MEDKMRIVEELKRKIENADATEKAKLYQTEDPVYWCFCCWQNIRSLLRRKSGGLICGTAAICPGVSCLPNNRNLKNIAIGKVSAVWT